MDQSVMFLIGGFSTLSDPLHQGVNVHIEHHGYLTMVDIMFLKTVMTRKNRPMSHRTLPITKKQISCYGITRRMMCNQTHHEEKK